MALEIGVTVSGEVVSIPPEGMMVALSDGQIGLVAVCSSLPAETLKSRFQVGERVTVRIIGKGEDGRLNLSILSSRESKGPDAFDQAVHHLNHVLKNCPPTLSLGRKQRAPSVEEGVKEWVTQVDEAIDRLRRHRTERLSETFYDAEGEGGRHAKRDRRHR